ncbi:hypothetical protein B7P43_G04543 [Cryptotermes secundus]|uniref:HTH CENPB-type domain-containing protein n=1 Tax=Cryptotermes secundus TaxID=105785 RepID=A0A2J7QLJ7_9NEOP|nr:hypothetical protein B7P43_G04543 [Cryptotermes secundus]
MSPKKKPQQDSHKRIKITLELKRKIIEKRERGVSVADLARTYNRSTSTICTILKNKDKIKEIDASKGVTRISAQRLRVLDDVERLLLIWINEKQLQGDTINENIICEKAKVMFADLVKKTPGSSMAKEGAFKGSRGWFEKFKRRTGIHRVVGYSEAASSDTKAAENFIGDFKSLSEEGEEEVTAKQQSSGAIREMLNAWETVASYIEKHHPNKAVAMRATNLFNDNVVSHFHQILKHRQKQMSLDSFLVKEELDIS